jgi:hypothetical protein
MRIFVTERRVAHRLTSPEGPWIGNIPRDFRAAAGRNLLS